MAKRKDREIGPGDEPDDDDSPREKRGGKTDRGIEGILNGLAPIVQKAVEAGSAAAAAGMAAVDRARETVAGTPCGKCNTRIPANAKFCMECGAPAPKERRCEKCDAKLEPGAKFCPECGVKV